jgi:hypothetical protein
MNFAASLLAPFALLLSAIGVGEEQGKEPTVDEASAQAYSEVPEPADAPAWSVGFIRSFGPEAAQQVHIERRMTIRVSPRAPRDPAPPRETFSAPKRAQEMRFSERKIGKCIPIAGIAGVEPNGENSLILFMRDRRMINVALDRSCPSRAFYSGFYLSRSTDGMVCVDRDTLHSRSGSACKLTRMRQLVARED